MDEIDRAQEKMEIGLAYAIRCARMPVLAAQGTGRCLYCDELVGEGVRWCSISCRDHWQKITGVK
jgi:hypothetical protein